jgi:3-methyladenine DNA glycosylase AlkD
MAELKKKGVEKTRTIYAKHGHPEDRVLGVSVADLTVVAKSIKGEQTLALGLYDTGIMEAMYLAGMVATGTKMTAEQLQAWAEGSAGMPMISGYTVPWVTVEHPRGRELAVKWIGTPTGRVDVCGWCTYSGLVATKPDAELDLKEIERLLSSVQKKIGAAQERTKYTMNSFVIAVGSYVDPLRERAKAAAREIGEVSVDMGDTSCKVPLALAAIEKVEAAGKAGKKRKTIRC